MPLNNRPSNENPSGKGIDWALDCCVALSVAALAGAVWLGVAKWAPSLPQPAPWMRASVLVLASGAIGFGTNWLAIKMLFRPRKPRPWLVFWPQGLLPREQARFAAALARVVSERLLHPDAIADGLDDEHLRARVGGALREEMDALLRRPETRQALAEMLADGVRERGPEIVQRLRPELRAAIERGIDEHLTAERIIGWMRGAVHRFAQNAEMRRNFARWVFRQTAREGVMAQIVDILRERFYRFREKHPIRGFLAEQFVIDWDELRKGLLDALQSEEATEDLAQLLVEAAGSMLERLEGAESATVVAEARRAAVERVLDWVEAEAIPHLARRAGAIADTPEGWRIVEGAIDDLIGRVPDALFDPATGGVRPEIRERLRALQTRLVGALPLAEIVERQVLAMDPAAVESMVDEIGRRELAAIQVLGMVLGAAAGALLLAVL